MKLNKNFSEETRLLFFYNNECWWCLENQWDALHHILGRVSVSPLNAAPIHNHRCHVGNARLDSFQNRSKMLRHTLTYLISEGYVLTQEDKAFMKKYAKYYK